MSLVVPVPVLGTVVMQLGHFDEDADEFETVFRQVKRNLLTDVGDTSYGNKIAGLSSTTVTGMRYGTGTTAASKAGAGSAIVTYVSNSAQALDASFPTNVTNGSGAGSRVTWQVTWPSGTADNAAVSEVVLTNEASITNVAGTSANTIARAVFATPANKVSLALRVTWFQDVLG